MFSAMPIRRPLVGMALFAAAGFYLQRIFAFPPLLLTGLGGLLLAWACLSAARGRGTLLLYACCSLLAAARLAVATMPVPDGNILHAAAALPHGCRISGTVTEEPVRLTETDHPCLSFRMETDAVHLPDGWHRARTALRVYADPPDLPVAPGERWVFRGMYSAYESVRGGLRGSFRCGGGEPAERLSPARPSLAAACSAFRQRAAARLQSGLEERPEHHQLLNALLLGYRQGLPAELSRTFAFTGMLHIFAISGLHVGIMASLLIALLKFTGLSRPRWGLILIPALFLYVFTTGMKPSAMRAFTMAAVYFAAPLAGRRPDAASAIALAALLLTAVEPFQIFEPGFLLSFTVVSGIVLVSGFAARSFQTMRQSDWTTPLKTLTGRHPADGVLRGAATLAVTSLAAWLFSVPLTARFFNNLPIVAVAGNIAVIPLTFLIVLTACLTLLSSVCLSPAAAIFGSANRLFIDGLLLAVRFLSDLPGAYRFVCAPSVAVMFLWYAGWALFFTGPKRLRPLMLLTVSAGVLLWGIQAESRSTGTVVFGGGSSGEAVCIRLPERRYLLVEPGTAFSARRTGTALQRAGINRVHALVITDPRADPAAVRMLTRMVAVDGLWLPQTGCRDDLAAEAEARGIPVHRRDRPEWPVNGGQIQIRLRDPVSGGAEHPPATPPRFPAHPPAS